MLTELDDIFLSLALQLYLNTTVTPQVVLSNLAKTHFPSPISGDFSFRMFCQYFFTESTHFKIQQKLAFSRVILDILFQFYDVHL